MLKNFTWKSSIAFSGSVQEVSASRRKSLPGMPISSNPKPLEVDPDDAAVDPGTDALAGRAEDAEDEVIPRRSEGGREGRDRVGSGGGD